MKTAAYVLSGLLLLTATVAKADCTIKLQQDIDVSSESISINRNGKTLYQISQGGHLSIEGNAVDLSQQQSEKTEQYAGELAALVPRWVTMVSDALLLTESSLELALGDPP